MGKRKITNVFKNNRSPKRKEETVWVNRLVKEPTQQRV